MRDPLAGSAWSDAGMVAGFSQSPPNETLIRFAARERQAGGRVLVDIGCGAGRNAVPLAELGWHVLGLDLSWPMVVAARQRSRERPAGRLDVALAPMDALPLRDNCADFIVAHGIWNLAASSAHFRAAVGEAGRIARPGAALFVFTFSRTTIPPDAAPVAGEPFVFTEFSGSPQCFVTESQLQAEMAQAGFVPDPGVPLTEHNRPRPGTVRTGGPPVIFEAAFRYRG